VGDGRSGLGGAVRDAISGADPLIDDAGEDDIADLFGDDVDCGSPLSGSAFSLGLPDPVARKNNKGGRPKGAKNISTKKMIEFLTARYRHPLLGMADVAATSPHDIAQLIIPRDPETGEPAVKRLSSTTKTKFDQDGVPVSTTETKTEVFQLSKADLQWAFEFWFRVTKEFTEYMSTKQPRQIAGIEDLPPMFQVFLGAHQGGVGGVPEAPIGMDKNSMNTVLEGDKIDEVPQTEVPQTDPKPTATDDPELSGD